MTNTYVKINKKFPKGLIELYADVNSEAQKLAIPYMIRTFCSIEAPKKHKTV
ncbi:hypothetical protein Sa5Y_VC02032 [Vibrio cholerae]|nr:hypothetical protein Sa5Y_VC02032 [Vibrio cholerae]